jgi:hypothetical protein
MIHNIKDYILKNVQAENYINTTNLTKNITK